MKKHYAVYGLGAALVDTEITLSDADLVAMNVDKGVMTLVDEARQAELIAALDHHLVASKRASGGSAATPRLPPAILAVRVFTLVRSLTTRMVPSI